MIFMRILIFIVLIFTAISCFNENKKERIVIAKDTISKKSEETFNHFSKYYTTDSTNTLSGEIKTLELKYIIWGCECANWIESYKYDEGNFSHKEAFFIEPYSEDLKLPDSFDVRKNRLIVKGQFYNKIDYPKNRLRTEEKLEKARVFKYTEIKIK